MAQKFNNSYNSHNAYHGQNAYNRRTNQGFQNNRDQNEDALFQKVQTQVVNVSGLNEWAVDMLVNTADEIGKSLVKRQVKRTQLRHILDEVVRINSDVKQTEDERFMSNIRPRVALLKPRLAYQAGRENALKEYCDTLIKMIDKVHSKKDWDHFYEFVQAVVAYHRYYGGAD